MNKKQFMNEVLQYFCGNNCLEHGEKPGKLEPLTDQLLRQAKDKYIKIVNAKITGDLTPTEEHLLIEILQEMRDDK